MASRSGRGTASVCFIGILCWGAQIAGQHAGPPFLIGSEADELRRDIEHRFDPEALERWADGWRLARRFGHLVFPVVQRAWQAESRGDRRMLMLAAASWAAGANAARDVIEPLYASRADTTVERLCALLPIALGPGIESSQAVDPSPLVRFVERTVSSQPAVAIGACLALWRLPSVPSAAVFQRLRDSVDPGLAAAARVAVPMAGDLQLTERWCGKRPPRHAGLVRRAAMLAVGRHGVGLGDDTPLVLPWIAEPDGRTAELRCSALAIAMDREPARWLARVGKTPTASGLVGVCATDRGREAAFARGWLQPRLPLTAGLGEDETQERNARRRLAVSWYLAAPPNRLLEKVREVARDREVADVAALALAWRLFGFSASAAKSAIGGNGDLFGPSVEGEWVRASTSAPEWVVDRSAGTGPALQRALGLYQQGRLPRTRARRELEDELWRRGVHPGSLVRDEQLAWIADILPLGDKTVEETGPDDYMPDGIAPSDERLLRVLSEVLNQASEAMPTTPPLLRLRD